MMGATYKAWCVLKVIPSTSAQGRPFDFRFDGAQCGGSPVP